MQFFFTNTKNEPKFKCFACERCFSVIDLVQTIFPKKTYQQTLDYLEELYTPEHDPINDRELPYYSAAYRASQSCSLSCDERLMETYHQAIRYRQLCPAWQQMVADKLGLPFEALNRADIGKSFTGNDGNDPECGDLVTFNLYNGRPVALKVRHTNGVGYPYHLSYLNYATNTFHTQFAPIGESRAFRQAGTSGMLCFGHDSITAGTDTVAIVEGQSDVLAVCAAAQQCGITTLTAIGRDSASHILRADDLSALSGKSIIYCQDNDDAGTQNTDKNLGLLKQYCDNVRIWTPSIPSCKDIRATYISTGATALINNLFNTSVNA